MRSIEVQWELFAAAQNYLEKRGDELVGGPVAREVIRRWEHVLEGLESDPESLAGQIDWVTKRRVIEGFRDRHGLDPSDMKLAALDLQYHDLRPHRSLFARLGAETLVEPEEVQRATGVAPTDTRAYFRGQCLARWPEHVVAANWDSMVFEVDGKRLRRIPMMEPCRGTEKHVGTLLDTCETVEELLDRLSAGE